MKIAIVTETFLPSTDGVVTRLCEAIRWFVKQGNEVIVIAPDLGVSEFEGAKVIGVPCRSFFFYKSKKFSLPQRKVGKIIKDFHPDLIHIVNPALLGSAGIYYARKFNYPMVASYHTNVPQYLNYYRLQAFKPLMWWYFKKLHSYADLNLCPSHAVKQELIDRKFHNMHIWERGVDLDRFGPDQYSHEMRNRLSGGEPNKKLLLFVGRLASEKEVYKIKPLLERDPNVRLAIVGDGPERESLELLFKGTNTVFTGFLHGKELGEAYASADAFIFPSITETFGLVILEAMASGLPVIAAKSGPTLEQIQDGRTGLLFENEDTESMLQAVHKLEDDLLFHTLKKNARNEAEQYSWITPSQQLLDYYQEVVEDKFHQAQ
ncbi:glycosyl transferase [Pontibacillus halophilus JSM 076056 = DSM 19796]|uniref:Glycosyl transferase n=1 Tax=Pontibacillus halophilus JSM 076056 = DSM 19796 TaxID=1385510 RepID=A0A0A5I877_9BACI|nr:glycosyltransferase family 1 protein [Pontibacillus halophilus]KGX92017.1 glycosyl transferase [Pontibacillus halophilus JSM 076056 = DSM 19796]